MVTVAPVLAGERDGVRIEAHLTGWQRIHVTNFEHPYMRNWWVPGCTIGYEHTFVHTIADFVNGCVEGKLVQPTFEDGVKNQRVLEAVEESAKSGKWVKV